MELYSALPYTSAAQPVDSMHPHSGLETLLVSSPPSITRRIFDAMSKPELVSLTLTSSKLRTVVTGYERQAWDIDTFLGLWFRNVVTFKAALAFAGAVVGGSQVVRFFERLPPNPRSDLDVITRVGGVFALSRLLESQGYSRIDRRPEQDEEYPLVTDILALTSSKSFCRGGGRDGIIQIFDFVKDLDAPLDDDTNSLKVQVIVVAQHPIHHIIHTFHSTLVMNFITHKEAVSLFPRSSFIDAVAYPNSKHRLGFGWNPHWKRKYEGRGYRVSIDDPQPKVSLGRRSAKDMHSWCIPFPANTLLIREEERGYYMPLNVDEVCFEVSLLHEPGRSRRHVFRIGIFEPEVWDYLYPWHILS
ncbi:hypothetical protein D9611_006612 [Ephemerocybe angulata]|uniref:F-box domain-containing protein n=1 Tax=Ephemerocybe angulata TaxID=980116 RepID=A0A8H5C8N9_9AGAR|nr:hypothetical protein D9611_006612 [Tulosesus angulatus]